MQTLALAHNIATDLLLDLRGREGIGKVIERRSRNQDDQHMLWFDFSLQIDRLITSNYTVKRQSQTPLTDNDYRFLVDNFLRHFKWYDNAIDIAMRRLDSQARDDIVATHIAILKRHLEHHPVGSGDAPRAYTKDEIKHQFLSHLRGLATYWGTLDCPRTPTERCEGMAHSILAMIDGASLGFPAINLVPVPCEGDKAYCIANGENYFEPGVPFNDDATMAYYYHHLDEIPGVDAQGNATVVPDTPRRQGLITIKDTDTVKTQAELQTENRRVFLQNVKEAVSTATDTVPVDSQREIEAVQHTAQAVTGAILGVIEGNGEEDSGYFLIKREADLAMMPATQECWDQCNKDIEFKDGLDISPGLQAMYDEIDT